MCVNKEGIGTRHMFRTGESKLIFIACLTIILIVLGAVKLNFIYYDYDYDYCYDYVYYYCYLSIYILDISSSITVLCVL